MKKFLSTVSLMALMTAPSFGSDMFAKFLQNSEEKQKIQANLTNKKDELEALFSDQTIKKQMLVIGTTSDQAKSTAKDGIEKKLGFNPFKQHIELNPEECGKAIHEIQGIIETLSKMKLSDQTVETENDPKLNQSSQPTEKETQEQKRQNSIANIIQILSVGPFTSTQGDIGTVDATVKRSNNVASQVKKLNVFRQIIETTKELQNPLFCLGEKVKNSKLIRKKGKSSVQRTLQRIATKQKQTSTVYTILGTKVSFKTPPVMGVPYAVPGVVYTSSTETAPFTCKH